MKDIKTSTGKSYKANETQIEATTGKCLVADDFRQEEFVSPYTGQTLPYNIYLPKDYNPEEKYPLVLFIHDAGVASGDVTHTLYQAMEPHHGQNRRHRQGTSALWWHPNIRS